MSTHAAESTTRPEPDKVLKDIADYVHNYKIESDLAYETARLCLIDTIGCGLEGLRFPECTKLLGPVVEGTVVPNGTFSLHWSERIGTESYMIGTKVPGTNYQLDPIRGAFNIGTIIRWLDFNDCFLAAECTCASWLLKLTPYSLPPFTQGVILQTTWVLSLPLRTTWLVKDNLSQSMTFSRP